MNCKPGDLAVVVSSDFPENIGLVVSVLSLSSECYEEDDIHWLVRSCGRPLKFEWFDDGRTGTNDFGFDVEVDSPDSTLRPIRNPGEDARDETLSWKQVPKTDDDLLLEEAIAEVEEKLRRAV